MAASFYHLLVIFSVHILVLSTARARAAGGFTVDLIHRDSPQSPLYDPSSTKSERLTNAFQRSLSRAARFFEQTSDAQNSIQSQIVPMSGEFLMKLSIGTPSFEMFGVADTGSDLTWTQCAPCDQCYKQNSPLFVPKNSSTYRDLSCQSQPCKSSEASTCVGSQSDCQYRMAYGDQSYTVGKLAQETFTFGSTSSGKGVLIPKLVFGCGHNNQGTFNESATGIIGLGGGPLSIIQQLGDSISGKFSYCLVSSGPDSNINVTTSKINFGDNALVEGSGVVSTPIVPISTIPTFYYLTLEAITVGNKTMANYPKAQYSKMESDDDVQEGNIIIDSGTTLNFLPAGLYQDLESELKQAINSEPVAEPSGFLSLCYTDHNINVPTITFKFTGGADLELAPTSTFVEIGELLCLAMLPSEDLAIFGNLSQMNFLIGYDLVNKQVSFMPTDCSKH